MKTFAFVLLVAFCLTPDNFAMFNKELKKENEALKKEVVHLNKRISDIKSWRENDRKRHRVFRQAMTKDQLFRNQHAQQLLAEKKNSLDINQTHHVQDLQVGDKIGHWLVVHKTSPSEVLGFGFPKVEFVGRTTVTGKYNFADYSAAAWGPDLVFYISENDNKTLPKVYTHNPDRYGLMFLDPEHKSKFPSGAYGNVELVVSQFISNPYRYEGTYTYLVVEDIIKQEEVGKLLFEGNEREFWDKYQAVGKFLRFR